MKYAARAATFSLLTVAALVGPAIDARAQSQTEFDRVGAQPNRDYMRLQPFEHLDTQSGNVIITLPMLTLPGNAGHDLHFQLTYNANIMTIDVPPWSFGVAGVPMRVNNQAYDPEFRPGRPPISDTIAETRGMTPLLVMADGGERPTMFRDDPNSTTEWVISGDFWKYNGRTHKLYMPDGTTCTYDPASGRLTEILDIFNNRVTFDWTVARQLTVTQYLGNDPPRTIVFALNQWFVPTRMTYEDRVWQYLFNDDGEGFELQEARPPVGPSWTFEYYDAVDLVTRRLRVLTTPQGGTITYDYTQKWLSGTDYRVLLHSRVADDQQGTSGEWIVEYAYLASCNCSMQTTITTPSAQVIYAYGRVDVPDTTVLIDGAIAPTSVTVNDAGGTELEAEALHYQQVPVVSHGGSVHFDGPELLTRTIWRAGHSRSYITEYAYGASSFGDYHHPNRITETGELTRTTLLTYAPPRIGSDVDPVFVVGLPASQTINSDDEGWARCWTYDNSTGFSTGFKIRETEFGATCMSAIATTFAPDGYGNVATVTNANNKATTYTYSYGRVADTVTQEYAVQRVINPDGTVHSETQAGRTTTFQYDDLSRLTETQPPGGTNVAAPIVTAYDSGTSLHTTRGSSSLTTTLDGFGRPIATVNSVGVHTTTHYDAEGRVDYESYPFTGADDIGTNIEYDGLGRVTKRTNPGGTFSLATYGAGTVTLVDENGRTTTQTWKAFGDPDAARLTVLVDADQKIWSYSYHALGQLWAVQAQDGTMRLWNYNDQNRLSTETHPESGVTTYSSYDLAGNLTGKSTANLTTFQYTYDGNDRVKTITAGTHTTTITYEPGSDNRLATTDGTVTTSFTYDGAGRPYQRQQVIGPYVLSTSYQYDSNDNVREITYPGGRKIGYDVDSEREITHVFETAAGRDYAFGMTYHPSGALTTYTAGNGIPTTIGYDPERYWVRSIASGALQLTYDQYDGVGNVGSLADSRPGMNQTFTYDAVDRLATANGWASIGYAYDVHGNRQTASGTTYQYQSGTLRLIQQGINTFGYDNNGNLTSAPNATYTYTPEDWLSTATSGGTATNYLYDADGWRVRKTAANQTTLYVRGLRGELLTEWRNPGPTGHTRDYVYAGSRLLAAIDRDVATQQTACGGNSIPDGSPHPITISTGGGSATVPFEGSACRRVSVLVTVTSGNLGCFWSIQVRNAADNSVVGTALVCGSATGFMEPVTLPFSGSYNVVVTAGASSTGSATVRIYDVVDVATPITANGPAVTANLATPGQNTRLPFSGMAGERVSVLVTLTSGTFYCNALIQIRNAATNAVVGSPGYMCNGTPQTALMEPVTLPATDSYVVVVDPSTYSTGVVNVNLYDVVDVTTPITANGPTVTANLTTPGQNTRLPFNGTMGERVSVLATLTSGTFYCCARIQIRNAATNALVGTDAGFYGASPSTGFMEPVTLPATDSYVVVVDPSIYSTGVVNVNLYDVVDVTTPITASGPTVTANLTTPGQNARLPFSGTMGERVSVLARLTSGMFYCSAPVQIRNAATNAVVGNPAYICGGSPQTAFIEPVTLPATDSYVVVVDPSIHSTGTVDVNLYDVVDVTGSIGVNGSSVPVTLTIPGQIAQLAMSGTAGQVVTVRMTGGTTGYTTVKLLKPDGSTQTSTSSSGNFNLTTQTLSTNGTYTVVVDPYSANIGSITVAVTSP